MRRETFLQPADMIQPAHQRAQSFRWAIDHGGFTAFSGAAAGGWCLSFLRIGQKEDPAYVSGDGRAGALARRDGREMQASRRQDRAQAAGDRASTSSARTRGRVSPTSSSI